MKQWGLGLMAVGVIVAVIGVVGLVLDGDDGETQDAAADVPAAPAADPDTQEAEGEQSGDEEPGAPAPDPEDVVSELYGDLQAAIDAGDVDALVERLHPAVVDLYGEGQCREFLARFASIGPQLTVQDASDPAPFTFDRDGANIEVGSAYSAQVTVTVEGQDPFVQEAHVIEVDGTLRWFTDCGEPTS